MSEERKVLYYCLDCFTVFENPTNDEVLTCGRCYGPSVSKKILLRVHPNIEPLLNELRLSPCNSYKINKWAHKASSKETPATALNPLPFTFGLIACLALLMMGCFAIFDLTDGYFTKLQGFVITIAAVIGIMFIVKMSTIRYNEDVDKDITWRIDNYPRLLLKRQCIVKKV